MAITGQAEKGRKADANKRKDFSGNHVRLKR